MQRSTLIYIMIIFISIFVFSAIFPYPIFSPYTNITTKNMTELNNYCESERTLETNQNIALLNVEWADCINYILPINAEIELIDPETKTSLFATRIGGKNHADIEFDELSFKALKSTCQNWSWHRKSVLIKLNETCYLPASLACYPHGLTNNNTSGHFCLHFKNSKTHGTNKIDVEHQKQIEKLQNDFQKIMQ